MLLLMAPRQIRYRSCNPQVLTSKGLQLELPSSSDKDMERSCAPCMASMHGMASSAWHGISACSESAASVVYHTSHAREAVAPCTAKEHKVPKQLSTMPCKALSSLEVVCQNQRCFFGEHGPYTATKQWSKQSSSQCHASSKSQHCT